MTDLAAGLRNWAEGSYPLEAAVGVLTHAVGGYWLQRDDFIAACIDLEPCRDGTAIEELVAEMVADVDPCLACDRDCTCEVCGRRCYQPCPCHDRTGR